MDSFRRTGDRLIGENSYSATVPIVFQASTEGKVVIVRPRELSGTLQNSLERHIHFHYDPDAPRSRFPISRSRAV